MAALLAESYLEARRLMDFDHLLEQYTTEREHQPGTGDESAFRERKMAVIREVALTATVFLERIFPHSKGTHTRELSLLRKASS